MGRNLLKTIVTYVSCALLENENVGSRMDQAVKNTLLKITLPFQSVTTSKPLKAGDELFTFYGYGKHATFPADFLWYWETKAAIDRQERLELEEKERESETEKKKKKATKNKKGKMKKD